MIRLRPDQAEVTPLARVALRMFLAILVRAPTGWGKSMWAAFLILKILAAGKTVGFAVHRRDLITQQAKTFDKVGIAYSYIAAGLHHNIYRKCNICSMATLRNRKHKHKFDYLFVDEAHLACAAGWIEVINYYKEQGTKIIGLSATPARLDGRSLGDVFDTMVEGPSVRWLIENGHLSKYRAFAPAGVDLSGVHSRNGDYVTSEVDEIMAGKAVLAGAVRHWRKYAAGKRTIAFTPSIARSEQLAAEFRANGVMAVALDGNTPEADRIEAFKGFANRQIDVIVNCELFCAGFDLAAQVDMDVTVEAVVLYRPTQSLALHLQQVGRALRKKPEPAIIIDLVGNLARLGLPDEDREWSLSGDMKVSKKAASQEEKVRVCPQCGAAHEPAPRCVECGHTYEVKARKIAEVEGELEELDIEAVRLKREQEHREQAAEVIKALKTGKPVAASPAMQKQLQSMIAKERSKGTKNAEAVAAHKFTALMRRLKEQYGDAA